MFAFLSFVLGASLLTLSIPYVDAVSVPDARIDWESHHDDTEGAKTIIAKKDPSLTNPATDYWWAKSFTSWGVYSVHIDEGAVGAGTVKYNPIGGGAVQYKGFIYYWDEDDDSQGYSFGTTTISGNAFPQTKLDTGETWERSSTSVYGDRTIPGLVWGHGKFAVQQSNQANALDGAFSSNKIHDGTSWINLASTDYNNYCENLEAVSGKDIELVGGSENTLDFGTSAESDDCALPVFESHYLPG